MMPCPGAVIVWSGSAPNLVARRAPFTLGRSIVPDDDRVSIQHVEIGFAGMQFVIADPGSRNGTSIDAVRVSTGNFPAFSILRAGRTIAVLVPDVRPYEQRVLTRCSTIWRAASLAAAHATLERSARAEEHVTVIGPFTVGRALARHYAELVGGEHVVVDLDVVKLDTVEHKLAGARPRTMILELARPLTLPDQPELEAWLETDVRMVSLVRDLDAFKFMPAAITHRLTANRIEVPPYRFDEIAPTIAEMVIALGLTPHATLIESALLQLRRLGEEALLRFVTSAAQRCKETGAAIVRGQDLDEFIDVDAFMRNCHVGRPR